MELTHFDESGHARMVDVTHKDETAFNKFESLVRWAEAMCDAPGNS